MLTSISAGYEALQQTLWNHSPSFRAQTSVNTHLRLRCPMARRITERLVLDAAAAAGAADIEQRGI